MSDLTPGPAVACTECEQVTPVKTSDADYVDETCPGCGGYAQHAEIVACDPSPEQCTGDGHDFGLGACWVEK